MGLTVLAAAVIQVAVSAEIPVDEPPPGPFFDRAFDAALDDRGRAVIVWERTSPLPAIHAIVLDASGEQALHVWPRTPEGPADTAVECPSYGGCTVAWSDPSFAVLDGARAAGPGTLPLGVPTVPAPIDIADRIFVRGDAAPILGGFDGWAPVILGGAPDLTVARGLAVWIQGDDVVGVRIDDGGTPLGETMLIASGFNPELPRVARAGDRHMVVWSDGTQSRIRAALVGPDGPSPPIDVTDNTRWRIAPSVAPGDDGERDGWLVVWFDACDQYVAGARLDETGALIDTTELRFSPGRAGWDGVIRTARPGVAGFTTGWIVAFAAVRADVTEGFVASAVQVGLDGSFGAPRRLGIHRAPDIAATPDDFAVAWLEDGFVQARVLDEPVHSLGASSVSPRITPSAKGWRVVWSDLGGIILAADGMPGALFPAAARTDALLGLEDDVAVWIDDEQVQVGRVASPDLAPFSVDVQDARASVAFAAGTAGVLSNDRLRVVAAPAGPILDESDPVPPPATVASDGETFVIFPRDAAVAWDGSRYVLAWREGGDLHVAFADQDGTPLESDATPTPIGPGPEPRLACAAGRCAVAYEIAPATTADTARAVVRLIEATPSPLPPLDAGPASADASMTSIDGSRGDCGCRVAPAAGSSPAWLGLVLSLIWLRATTSGRRGGGSGATRSRDRRPDERNDDR